MLREALDRAPRTHDGKSTLAIRDGDWRVENRAADAQLVFGADGAPRIATCSRVEHGATHFDVAQPEIIEAAVPGEDPIAVDRVGLSLRVRWLASGAVAPIPDPPPRAAVQLTKNAQYPARVTGAEDSFVWDDALTKRCFVSDGIGYQKPTEIRHDEVETTASRDHLDVLVYRVSAGHVSRFASIPLEPVRGSLYPWQKLRHAARGDRIALAWVTAGGVLRVVTLRGK